MRKAIFAGFGTLLVVILISALRAADGTAPGVEKGPAVQPGQKVVVFFRGDVTGTFNDRVPDVSALSSRNGTMKSLDGDWLSIEVGGGKTELIPRSSIAMIEVEK